MPGRSRKNTGPDICEECFDGGWDALPEDAYAPGCQHGSWLHPDRVPGAEPKQVKREVEVSSEGMDLGRDVVTF